LVQEFESSQFGAAPPTQVPPEHVSLVVQALPSLQEAVLLVWTQPVTVLQESLVQEFESSQLGAAPPTQVPPEQVSLVVQALPSLHEFVLFVCRHVPLPPPHESVVQVLPSSHVETVQQMPLTQVRPLRQSDELLHEFPAVVLYVMLSEGRLFGSENCFAAKTTRVGFPSLLLRTKKPYCPFVYMSLTICVTVQLNWVPVRSEVVAGTLIVWLASPVVV
jgi:hypothetical protein